LAGPGDKGEFDYVVQLDSDGNIVGGGAAGGTSMSDDAAFTAASSSFVPVGGIVTADSVDSGDGGAFAMLANRQQKITLYSAAGAELTTIAVTNTGTFAVQGAGDVAHDSADSGSPLKIGAKAYSPDGTTPGTAVAELDRTNLKTDLDGRLYISKADPVAWHYHDDDASAVTTDGTLHADPGDGFSVFITRITFSIGAATASTLFIEEGSTKIWGPHNLPATIGAGFSVALEPPLKCSASTAVLITNTGSIVFAIDCDGFVAAT
jgi:hypothetical protein